jgi:hypothetical protein
LSASAFSRFRFAFVSFQPLADTASSLRRRRLMAFIITGFSPIIVSIGIS